jgi:hypothetical protein
MVITGPYLFLYARSDSLLNPGPVPASELRERSETIFGRVIYGERWRSLPEWSFQIDDEVNSLEIYEQGTQVHERRHGSWRSLFDLNEFSDLHSLYPERFTSYSSISRSWVLRTINIALVVGFLAAAGMALRYPRWRVIALLLVISYALMSMNFGSDTKRLFLFLSIIAAVFPVLAFHALHKLITIGKSGDESFLERTYSLRASVSKGLIGAFAILAILEIAPLALDQMRVMEGMKNTQGGGFASEGGIESVKVTGEWLKANLSPDDLFMAASPYEWEYYTGHTDLWLQGLDYRLYFLPADRIDYYMQLSGVRYVIVRSNQLVEDSRWNHIEMVPVSFQSKIEQLYEEAYVSPYGDIRVYDAHSRLNRG